MHGRITATVNPNFLALSMRIDAFSSASVPSALRFDTETSGFPDKKTDFSPETPHVFPKTCGVSFAVCICRQTKSTVLFADPPINV